MSAYRVLAPGGLKYPTDSRVLSSLVRGENLPLHQRKHTRAECGDIVTDLPEASVPILLAKGWITAVEPVARPVEGAHSE